MPLQHSPVVVHRPPSGVQELPESWHSPAWQVPFAQQSALVVQVRWPRGMHAAAQKYPVGDESSWRQIFEQHSSARWHAAPVAAHSVPELGKQRETPLVVRWQDALPPVQQFWEAPSPPQTSPSGRQLPPRSHRRRPRASGVPHACEQHSAFLVQTSWYVRQPPSG